MAEDLSEALDGKGTPAANKKRKDRSRMAWYWVDSKQGKGYGCWDLHPTKEGMAVCVFTEDGKKCGHEVAITGGAVAFRKHAEKHGLTEDEARARIAEKSIGVAKFFPKAPHLTPEQKSELRHRLLIALCNDGRPLGLFDKKEDVGVGPDRLHHDFVPNHYGVAEWLQLLHPSYTPPHRLTLRDDLLTIVLPAMRVKMKRLLTNFSCLSFVSDGWKNTSQNRQYRDLCCHGILHLGNRLYLVSFLLGLQPEIKKDARTVSSWIREMLDNYEISMSQRGVMVADGAESAAAREAGLEYWWCIAHWVNLTVHDAISKAEFVPEEIQRLKEFIGKVHGSSAYQASLNQCAGPISFLMLLCNLVVNRPKRFSRSAR